jgi:hypothetical protein
MYVCLCYRGNVYVPHVFCHMDCCRWQTTKLPTRFGSMGTTRVHSLHATTADVEREVVEQHDSSNIWPHVDQM